MPSIDTDSDTIHENVMRVREEIAEAARRAGRDLEADPVHVVAAAKYVDSAAVAALVEAGIDDIGENRLDALERHRFDLAELSWDATWHFIGALQSRKVAGILEHAQLLHSLCTTSALARIADAVPTGLPSGMRPGLLVQVNVAGDPAKEGLAPAEVAPFLESVPEHLAIDGLMTMPELADDPEASRPAFAALRELRDRLATTFGERHPLGALSMGTTQDFTVAVEEGATFVRLGSVLYARRQEFPRRSSTQ